MIGVSFRSSLTTRSSATEKFGGNFLQQFGVSTAGV